MAKLEYVQGRAFASGPSVAFTTIQVPSGTSPVADSTADTLTLATDGSIAITGNSTTDTITFGAPAAVTIAAAAIDWALGNVFTKTLAANTTFTFSNLVDGKTVVVCLTNTASNYTVTWPTVKWAGGVAPVMTIGAKDDVYTFIRIGSTTYGSAVQNMS
jgi:hypothetical protein